MAKNEEQNQDAAVQKNVYLFCGEDSFSAFEKATLWKQKFLDKYGDLNCLIYRGNELTGAEFQTALESYPFLSEKKLVFISDFLSEGDDDDQDKVTELLKDVPDYVVVLFWEHHKPDARTALYKRLVKVGQVENYELKSGPVLMRWIRQKAQAKGINLGESEAKFMVDLVGNNLWNLDKELDKLKSYSAGRSVDRVMIEKVVCPNPSSSIFKLTDLLGEKNLKESIRTLEILIQSGEAAVQMFFMLVRHFRIMAQVKDLAEHGQNAAAIAKIIKEHPFVVSKVYAQCRHFPMEELRKIYSRLLEIDLGFKTGRIRISTNDESELIREMEVFIVKSCM
jgi:DNA polymerase-3 subunit delta